MGTGGPPGIWEALPFPPNTVVGDATTQRTLARMKGCRFVRERTTEHAVVPPWKARGFPSGERAPPALRVRNLPTPWPSAGNRKRFPHRPLAGQQQPALPTRFSEEPIKRSVGRTLGGGSLGPLPDRGWDNPGSAFFAQAIALALDGDDVAVV